MDDQQLLAAIGQLIDEKLEQKFNEKLSAEREHTSRIIDEKLEQKLEHKLEQKLAPIKADLKRLNENVARIEVDHGHKLGALYDAHVVAVRNTEAIQTLNAKVEDHGHRIFALEQAASNS